MINKVSIKKATLFIIAFLISFNLQSQVPYLPNNAPPQNFSGSFSAGTQTNASCNVQINPLNVVNNANYDIKARYYIHVPPGNTLKAANFANGSFHAHIEPPPFEVVSYYPNQNGYTGILQYDKFELGVKLPPNITYSINSFFGAVNTVSTGFAALPSYTCNNGYGNVFNTNFINPYDPEQISIEATFSFPGKPNQTVYGFYYREYKDYTQANPNPTYATADWIEDTTLQYHWRVRFTPKYVGTYNVTWKIKVNGQPDIIDNIGQNFTTIPSNDLGFIKMGQNKKFLVTQPDSTQPEKTILPIGVVVAFPPAARNVNADLEDGLPVNECSDFGCDVTFPSRFWRHRQKIKTTIADYGGNYVRIVNAPYSYDVEYEKAGVYDARPNKPLGAGIQPAPGLSKYTGVNRQAIMWEFDRLLDMAKANNVYIQWVTESNENDFIFGIIGNEWKNYWKHNAYYNEIIASPKDTVAVNQFFTDANTIKAYKKRLRYTIARFGYSTNITVLELVNEIQQFRGFIANGSTLNSVFKNWLDTMTNYIRNPIAQGGLDHKDHLLTVSFEASDNTNPKWQVDSIGQNVQKLNFLSRHPYAFDKNKNRVPYEALEAFRTNTTLAYYKPCQAGELGLGPDWSKCNNPALEMEYLNPTFHSILWSTAFIGGLTTGLDNWDGGLEVDPNLPSPYLCGNGFSQHFKPLQSFINGINFDQDNYVPKFSQFNDSLEAFYLVNNGGSFASRAIGYAHNRTFFWYNFTNPLSTPFFDPLVAALVPPMLTGCTDLSPVLGSVKQVASGFLGGIKIDGLLPNINYAIDWYDTYIDQNPYLGSGNSLTNNFGSCIIIPPNFGANWQSHEFAFKIHLPGQQKQPTPADDTLSYLSNVNVINQTFVTAPEIKSIVSNIEINGLAFVYPNPGKGIYKIACTKAGTYKVDVINAYGAVMLQTNFIGNLGTVSIENYANGIYTFIVKGLDGTNVVKIIKE